MKRYSGSSPRIVDVATLILFTAIMGVADVWLVAWWIGKVWVMALAAGAIVGLLLSIASAVRRYLVAVSIVLVVVAAAVTIVLFRSSASAGALGVLMALGVFAMWYLAYDAWSRRANPTRRPRSN